MRQRTRLMEEVVPLKKAANRAKPVIEKHANRFNKHSRSKIDLEKFKLPSEAVVTRVIERMKHENPSFDHLGFFQAIQDTRKYYKHLEKIEKRRP